MQFDLNESERGNNAFRNEEGSSVIFIKLDNGKTDGFLQISFTPMNYPAWDISETDISEDGLVNHITYNLEDWNIDKCNLIGVNILNNKVRGIESIAEDVLERIELMEDKYGFDSNPDDETLNRCIRESADHLGYGMTSKMIKTCTDMYHENH